MKQPLFIFLFVVLLSTSYAQEYTLRLLVENLPQKEIYLAAIFGEKIEITDTQTVVGNNEVTFILKPGYERGMYRIIFDKNRFLDIIYNRENIEIKTDFNDLYNQLEIIQSMENKVYYEFLKRGNDYRRKFDLLAPLNDYYPRNDTFFDHALSQYLKVQVQFHRYIDSISDIWPDLWASRIIRQKKPLFYDPELDEFGRREFAREHYFDNADLTDAELLRSNVYTTMAIEYLSLYSDPNLTQDQLQDAFIEAVDRIMMEAMASDIVYQFIVEYLVGGFEKFHFDKVLDYIAKNYAPAQCENQERKTDLQTRLSKYADLSVGKPAPDFTTLDQYNKPIKLTELQAKHTLLIFWSSTCPHCNQLLPAIQGLMETSLSHKQLQVIAISLDTSRESWLSAIKPLPENWIHVADLEGWDGAAAIAYNIYATPTMFLLDQDKSILAKPITYDELKNALINANLLR